MNISSNDIWIIVTMAGIVVVTAFLFPALGLAGSEQTQDDIPEFNVSQTRFDFVGDLPEFPHSPSSGILNHSSSSFDDVRGDIQVELGEGDNGNRIFLVAFKNDTVHLTDVEASTINDTVTFTADDQTKTLDAYGYEVDVHSIDISEDAGKYEWVIENRPEDVAFLSSIPLVGGLFSAGQQLAAIVGWVGVSFFTISLIIVEGAFNIGGITFDMVVFFIDLFQWLFGTWFNTVDSAPGYAKVVLTVPGLILFLYFGKVTMMVIQTIKPMS